MPSSITTVLYNDFIKPKKRMILYVFLIAVFSIATYYAYTTMIAPKFAESFGTDVANDNTRTDQAKIMGFFANWCPHCKTAKPEWEIFTKSMTPDQGGVQYGNSKLIAEAVDCTDGNDPRIQQYKIDGYPTIIIINNGNVVKYEGSVKTDNLKKFATDTLGAPKV